MEFKEGMEVIFFDECAGILGAYDEGWYIKTKDYRSAWRWDERLPSHILKRGDLCYWVEECCIKPAKTKLGNTL